MPEAVTVTKILADLSDLARAARPLRNRILDALLSEARKEIGEVATKKYPQLTPVSDREKRPPPGPGEAPAQTPHARGEVYAADL